MSGHASGHAPRVREHEESQPALCASYRHAYTPHRYRPTKILRSVELYCESMSMIFEQKTKNCKERAEPSPAMLHGCATTEQGLHFRTEVRYIYITHYTKSIGVVSFLVWYHMICTIAIIDMIHRHRGSTINTVGTWREATLDVP